MPRFEPAAYASNLRLWQGVQSLAQRAGCTPAQLSLAWVLSKGEHGVAIPGTTPLPHLRENLAAAAIILAPGTAAELEELLQEGQVLGGRYSAASQAEVDTEQFR